MIKNMYIKMGAALMVLCPCLFAHADRIDELMHKMTVEEKIGQLNLLSCSFVRTGPQAGNNYYDEIRAGVCGSLLNVQEAEIVQDYQRMAVEETRLGIPLLIGRDVIHGFRTTFPVSLGLASCWDLGEIERAMRISAVEATASGINWTYAPMVDISRDPRWGRIAESGGEDSFLTSQIAKAAVRGFQGGDLARDDTLAACMKHFAAYGAAQAGRDYHTVDLSERVLRDTYLPSFKAAVDAGCATVMTAFNEVDGVPCTANELLLKKILREEWNFDGMVVTDYSSMSEMVIHGSAVDVKDAACQSMNAGVDMDMMGFAYIRYLKELVEEGAVTMEQIDRSVRHVLELKEKLGLFDDPYRYGSSELEKQTHFAPQHLRAAYEIAGKSMVLLKNKGSVLPLKRGQRIAVIGELAKAKRDLLGCWQGYGDAQRPVPILNAIEAQTPAVVYAKGCAVDDEDCSGFAEAVQAAKESDVVVLVLGETAGQSGEGHCRTEIGLPGVQSDLLRMVAETGKPVVLVLMNGRPLAVEGEVERADAVLEAWHPGVEGGKAVASILFGDMNPSGKLPATFPRRLGQVPIYYNMKNTGRPIVPGRIRNCESKYLDCANDPLFPFGFGLSYTTFDYSAITLDRPALNPGETITASVTVTNSGRVAGDEVVQLYIRDLFGSVTRPVKELKGFRKINLQPGESRTVEFIIGDEELTFLRRDMTRGTEPGDFNLFIGTNSRDVQTASFTLRQGG